MISYYLMFYVYILQSSKDHSYYTGYTTNLKSRLVQHNKKAVAYSSSRTPFRIVWYCAFSNKRQAMKFEKYLKQGSGLAFARKRLV